MQTAELFFNLPNGNTALVWSRAEETPNGVLMVIVIQEEGQDTPRWDRRFIQSLDTDLFDQQFLADVTETRLRQLYKMDA
jgi:hypothetical protein